MKAYRILAYLIAAEVLVQAARMAAVMVETPPAPSFSPPARHAGPLGQADIDALSNRSGRGEQLPGGGVGRGHGRRTGPIALIPPLGLVPDAAEQYPAAGDVNR